MRRHPRLLLGFIVFLILLSLFINIPIGEFLPFTKNFTFKKGLDLAGGTSLTYKAEMKDISSDQRNEAIESAREIIERRVNLFGVSEPIVHTSVAGEDFRIIVELPGIDIDQAKKIIGTTAQLSFWEQGASISGNIATPSVYPIGTAEILGNNPKKTNLTGKDLKRTSVSFDPNDGKPQVQLQFTSEGSKKFAEITKRNVNKIVAIVLDDVVIEAPRVNQPILTGDAVITGGFDQESAKALSTALNAGALPVPLVILAQHHVDATLGASHLIKSLYAGILGLVIIIIFMVFIYGLLGVTASVALIIYALIMMSIFKLSSITPYGITLTLSGIAGFILSIGMAVDANILIFERMKEEIRLGKSKENSLKIGFLRAWTSIRDSNIATLITCFVLYSFGDGMVKGFALVLAIGVLVSMFSAIIVTRTLLRIIYH